MQCHTLFCLPDGNVQHGGGMQLRSASCSQHLKPVRRKVAVMIYFDVPTREHKVRAACMRPSYLCPFSYTLAEGECKRLKQNEVLVLWAAISIFLSLFLIWGPIFKRDMAVKMILSSCLSRCYLKQQPTHLECCVDEKSQAHFFPSHVFHLLVAFLEGFTMDCFLTYFISHM